MRAYFAAFIPEQGGKFSVLFPDVPGCATWGEGIREAFEQALEALAGHLAALEMDGDPIPSASGYKAAWAKARAEYESFGLGPLPVDTLVFAVPIPDPDKAEDSEPIRELATL